jgi:F0F1-type ATP synthase assembly protein I
MSTEQSKSPLQFFAELGDLIARYAANPGFAIGMVIVSWVFWPIGALIASLLIAKLYAQSQTAPSQPAQTLSAPRSEDWLIAGGLVLIGIGVYSLVRQYLPELPWAVLLIAIGVLLIGLAYAVVEVVQVSEKIHSPYKYLFWGVVLILGGVAWRLSLMGWFELSWRFVLPGILIILGVGLLISGLARYRPASDSEKGGQP